MHKVLARQLRRLGIGANASAAPTLDQWQAFLERVEQTYVEADQDRYTLERSIELSSKEMQRLHERLAAERDKLRAIFESAALGILRLDAEGRVLDANPAAAAMLEEEATTLAGKELAGFFDAPISSRQPTSSAHSAQTSEEMRTRTDGSVAWLHQTKTWVRDGAGEIQFGTVVLDDITTKKHLELSLRHAQKLESVGRLASGIAHEINTPVQFVSDNIFFLKDQLARVAKLIGDLSAICAEDPRGAERAAAAREIGDWEYLSTELPLSIDQTLDGLARVATIVRSMKTFAHNDQGAQSPADLNAALATTLVVATHEVRGVATAITDFAALPDVVCCRSDLNQVFLNLIVNAAHAIRDRYGGSGELGEIKVSTRVSGEEAVIAIADTGAGIPADVQARIFEPFFTTKDVGEGTGQGLALARAIVVKNHRGTLEFESEVGRGTTFTIRLPIAGARPERQREAA